MNIACPRRRRTSPTFILTAMCGCMLAWGVGCMGPLLRRGDNDESLTDVDYTIEDDAPSSTRLVSGVAHPYGMNPVQVESVSLVTGLDGTGEDPAPSPQRAALLAEMNRMGIDDPNEVLASPNTALVLVRAILRPGIKEGDTFDVEVRVPSKSATTSLRSGMLLETRLSETAVLGGQIRKGHEAAIAQGPILVDPSADAEKNPAAATKGRILGGGIATKSRKLGLILDHQHKSIRLSQLASKSINERFHTYVDGRSMGCATPKTDEFIDLVVHPRYKENVGRYMKVIRSVAIEESQAARLERLKLLETQMLDPVTAESAALRLEAIGGEQAIEILKRGAESLNPEVRFYSAEALAYLDVTEAVAPLAKAALDEPAFRIKSLIALGSMEDGAASEALVSMLTAKSAETRYGAFRALTQMAPDNPEIRAENLGGKFKFRVLDVAGPSMIHVTRSHHPEVVLFGKEHSFQLPLMLDAGQRILVNGRNGDTITVSRFSPGEPTQQRQVSTRVEDVIRAVIDVGGEYPDVVQMLQQAKNAGALPSRFRVDAIPQQGRQFDRAAEPDEEATDAKLLTKAE